jgi:hypothetical protein
MSINEVVNKKTCTTLFLVPGLGLNLENIKKYGFINGFMDDKDGTHYNYAVYVLFKPLDVPDFQDFLISEYQRAENLIEDYDYQGGFVTLVYRFPEKFRAEYILFKKGKYSRFSQEYIDILPKERSGIDSQGGQYVEPSLQIRVCTRSKALVEYWEKKLDIKMEPGDELWSIPNLEKETLDISKIREKYDE